ncbi:MAG: GntR family transcriptional regulator [Clostridia bacterium]|nr:GntR family transcriptional regulator [Clostridia bacterium]
MSISRNRTSMARDWAYERLAQAIVEGELRPGERLVEMRLSERFQVSRTPLREALQRLEQEGLVERLPSGRMAVARLTPERAAQLFSVRAVLEALAAYEAAGRFTDEQAERLRALADEIELAAQQGRHRDVSRRGAEFHALVHHVSGNQVASALLDVIRAQLQRYRKLGPEGEPGRSAAAAKEHRRMCELLLAGERRRAALAMYRHVMNSRDAVLRVLTAEGGR